MRDRITGAWTRAGIRFFRKGSGCVRRNGDVGVQAGPDPLLLDDDIAAFKRDDRNPGKTDGDGAPITVEDNAVCIFTTQRGCRGVMEAKLATTGRRICPPTSSVKGTA